MNEPTRYAAVCFVQNSEGLILAVSRKNDPTAFGLPGGKVDFGENFLDAACRELFEETGLVAYSVEYLRTRLCKGEKDYETVCYRMKVVGEVFTSEAGRVAWVKPEVLLAGPFSEYNKGLFDQLGLV